MTSAKRLYRFQLGLAMAGFSGLMLAVIAALTAVSIETGSMQSLTAACRRLLPALTGAEVVVLMSAILAAVVTTRAALSARRQLRASRQYLSSLVHPAENVVVDSVRCRVFFNVEPIALCAGCLRPHIYISTGAINRLPAEELFAVVAHEEHHRRRRDPLRLLAGRALANALFFLPVLRSANERYAALAELAADEAAVARCNSPAPLASALLRLGKHPTDATAVVGVAPERVDFLAGSSQVSRWKLPMVGLACGLVAATLVLMIGGLLAVQGAGASVALPLLLAQTCMPFMVIGPALLLVAVPLLLKRTSKCQRAVIG